MVRIQRHPEGARVRIRHGRLPIDPSTLGRGGVIVQPQERTSDRYVVQLDGETELRIFAEDELELESGHGEDEADAHLSGGSEGSS